MEEGLDRLEGSVCLEAVFSNFDDDRVPSTLTRREKADQDLYDASEGVGETTYKSIKSARTSIDKHPRLSMPLFVKMDPPCFPSPTLSST